MSDYDDLQIDLRHLRTLDPNAPAGDDWEFGTTVADAITEIESELAQFDNAFDLERPDHEN